MSAHGQNPFLSERATDWTNDWLGWSLIYSLKASTLIGETTLKRSGFSEIVLRAALFWSSFLGGDGSGAAVKVEYAETVLGVSESRHLRVGVR